MEISPHTLNRLSLYLRCLHALEQDGIERISSLELANQFHLSAAQIRKDLAQFGEFGIRGVGYDIGQLIERLTALLGLDRSYPLVIVGMGNLGTALARSVGFNSGAFRVVAGVDNDPKKIGRRVGRITVRNSAELERVVADEKVRIGVLTVPAEVAQENYEALVEAGVKAVLNFAPTRLDLAPGVRTKDVDLRIDLEELGYFLGR